MSLYIDSSILLARYFSEPLAPAAAEHLNSDPTVVTARLTLIEVRRNLARLRDEARLAARAAFDGDLARMGLLELDASTCDLAATIAELTGVRSLDALHLAAAKRASTTTFATFDLRQAQAARTLGLTVVGS